MSDSLKSRVEIFEEDVALTRQLVQGDDSTSVSTNNGSLPSFAKLQRDLKEDVLNRSEYEFLADYAAGVQVDYYYQLIRAENGDGVMEFWRPSAGTVLPYQTTGAGMPEGGAFVPVGDASLRSELGSGLRRAADLSELKSITGRFAGDTAYLQGRTNAGEGEGTFRWDDSDLSAKLVIATVNSTSVDATTDTITSAGHGLLDGDGVTPDTSVNGLIANDLYWVVNATTETFQLSTSYGGPAYDLTGVTNFSVSKLIDPLQGVFVSADRTGSTGAWVRKRTSRISANFFGAIADAISKNSYVTATDVSKNFICAAKYAKQLGASSVIAEPGVYHCPGLSPSDMNDLYVVGDGVQFTVPTNIIAMTLAEDKFGLGFSSASPGTRGVIGFEFDDATTDQWSKIVPLFKKYGIVGGIAWPVTYDRPWIREIYRHGWDILPHGLDDEDYSLLTPSEIHANAEAMLTAMDDMIGKTENLHFVYIAHKRNEQSDDILSQYFSTGRGQASTPGAIMPYRSSGSWLHGAISGDSWVASETALTESKKEILLKAAENNARVLMYFHSPNPDYLRILIEFCLEIGLSILPPSKIKEPPVNYTDRYFKDFGNWDRLSGNVSFDETVSSPNGVRSLRVQSSGSSNSNFYAAYKYNNRQPIVCLKDFSVLKVSFLYKSATEITSALPLLHGNGFAVYFSATARSETGVEAPGGETAHYMQSLPTLPAADWDNRVVWYIYVPCYVMDLAIGLGAINLKEPYDFWIDDVTIQKIGETDCAGTTFEMDANADSGQADSEKFSPRFVLLDSRTEKVVSSRTPSINGSLAWSGGRVYSSDSSDKGNVSLMQFVREHRWR